MSEPCKNLKRHFHGGTGLILHAGECVECVMAERNELRAGAGARAPGVGDGVDKLRIKLRGELRGSITMQLLYAHMCLIQKQDDKAHVLFMNAGTLAQFGYEADLIAKGEFDDIDKLVASREIGWGLVMMKHEKDPLPPPPVRDGEGM